MSGLRCIGFQRLERLARPGAGLEAEAITGRSSFLRLIIGPDRVPEGTRSLGNAVRDWTGTGEDCTIPWLPEYGTETADERSMERDGERDCFQARSAIQDVSTAMTKWAKVNKLTPPALNRNSERQGICVGSSQLTPFKCRLKGSGPTPLFQFVK